MQEVDKMIYMTTGLTSQGKTLELAKTAYKLLYRNRKWFKKTGIIRPIAPNFPIAQHIYDEFGNDFIQRWYDPEELPELRECDVLWDEVANGLDSANWQNVSMDIKSFLRQHAKRGIDIYGTTQRWGSVDLNFRSLVDEMFVAHKLIGSARPSATKPEVKFPWGIIWLDEQSQESFVEDKLKSVGFLGWRIFFITKALCSLYDTRFEVPQAKFAPLKHIERFCKVPNCGYHKIPKIGHL
jgi:hypothetical protein